MRKPFELVYKFVRHFRRVMRMNSSGRKEHAGMRVSERDGLS